LQQTEESAIHVDVWQLVCPLTSRTEDETLATGEYDATEKARPSAVIKILPLEGALVFWTELTINLL